MNVLVYAHDESSPYYAKASAWWRSALAGDERIGIATIVEIGFVRLSTKVSVNRTPWSTAAACEAVRRWYRSVQIERIEPGPRHYDLLDDLLQAGGAGGNLVNDAHLVALAIEHRATVCSHDRDFARFSGFRLLDPLA